MAKGNIGELIYKPSASKEKLRRGPLGIICGVSVKILPHPFNVAPTSHYRGSYSRIEDYGMKKRITPTDHQQRIWRRSGGAG